MNRFLLGILFVTLTATASAGDIGNIFPFTFTEHGLETEGVDFGQVPQGSFHQRFIVITNTSNLKVKDVSVRISGNYRASNCMSSFLSGDSCMLILNYTAPGHVSRDKKWLTIEFNVLLPDGIKYSDAQRLLVIGGTLESANEDPA